MKINVGFLVSYDYELLRHSIPLVYKSADSITLAVDEKRRTWSGNTFTIDQEFFNWIKTFDTENKIKIYEGDFYVETLNAMENDTRERNLLASAMGDGICIQIDADEYFVDFDGFVDYLKRHKKKLTSGKAYQICPSLIDIYKILDEGVLVSPKLSGYYIGSNNPEFVRARKSKDQQKWYVPYYSIHQTWGRSEDELRFKLKNWGHNIDFDLEQYLDFWKSINKDNYHKHKNFHPLNSTSWKTLEFVPGKSIDQVVMNISKVKQVSKWYLFRKNLGQQIKYLFKV